MADMDYLHIPPELLQAVLDNPYEGTVIIDEKGIIRHFSKSNEPIYGVTGQEALGKHIQDIIPNSRLHIVARTGKAEIGDTFTVKGRHVIVSRYPIKDGDRVIGAIGKAIFHNLKAFIALKDKVKELESTVRRYQQGMRGALCARYTFDHIVGNSPRLLQAKEMARRMAYSDSSILLLGESGTGKELFAHAIHQESPRREHSFVRVNCASIPGELFESELFGYEPGAFTGAAKSGKPGKFELSHRGTIFLDEVGELPLSLQAKLLRVLQEKEVERLGSRKPQEVDFRVIAATNKDLEARVKEGYFRTDLYYRLNVVSIHLPPLREMREDISLLAEHFMEKLRRSTGSAAMEIAPEVISTFMAYGWPGNVREMENVMERAMTLCPHIRLLPEHLPEDLSRAKAGVSHQAMQESAALQSAVECAEKELILDTIRKCAGNKAQAARLLNIHRTTLYYKLRKHRIAHCGA